MPGADLRGEIRGIYPPPFKKNLIKELQLRNLTILSERSEEKKFEQWNIPQNVPVNPRLKGGEQLLNNVTDQTAMTSDGRPNKFSYQG